MDDNSRALAKSMGRAISKARADAGLSAVQLSARIKELGLPPIHRVALGKMEAGERDVTVAELATLARALGVPPIELIYPDLPHGSVEAWPGESMTAITAAQWFSGEYELLPIDGDNDDDDLYLFVRADPEHLRISSARAIEAAHDEYRKAEMRVQSAAGGIADEVDLPTALRVAEYATDKLVQLVRKAIQRGETVKLEEFPSDVQVKVREGLSNSAERARQVADDIRREARDGR